MIIFCQQNNYYNYAINFISDCCLGQIIQNIQVHKFTFANNSNKSTEFNNKYCKQNSDSSESVTKLPSLIKILFIYNDQADDNNLNNSIGVRCWNKVSYRK